MFLRDIFDEAYISVRMNKLRTFLTILGVIIGIAAVIIMIAAGQSVEYKIANHFSDLGTNTIMLRAVASNRNGIRTGYVTTLTIDDVAEIARLSSIYAITPVQMAGAQLVYGNQNLSVALVGAYPDYKHVLDVKISQGNFFDLDDIKNTRNVAIIGPRAASELGLSKEKVVGEIIRINNVPFTICGVSQSKGDTALGSQDDMVIVPLTTFKRRLIGDDFPNSVPIVGIRLFDNADNAFVIEQMTSILRSRHRLHDDEADDFQFFDMKQIMESMNNIINKMQLFIIAVASISLLVGGIGIMNMMLVSVTERTREIGIRKSIGACQKDIIIQFLSESVLIALLGGFVGIGLGIIIAQGIGSGILNFIVPFSWVSIIISILTSTIVGVLAGILPAIRASKLNPIDCMRYE